MVLKIICRFSGTVNHFVFFGGKDNNVYIFRISERSLSTMQNLKSNVHIKVRTHRRPVLCVIPIKDRKKYKGPRCEFIFNNVMNLP